MESTGLIRGTGHRICSKVSGHSSNRPFTKALAESSSHDQNRARHCKLAGIMNFPFSNLTHYNNLLLYYALQMLSLSFTYEYGDPLHTKESVQNPSHDIISIPNRHFTPSHPIPPTPPILYPTRSLHEHSKHYTQPHNRDHPARLCKQIASCTGAQSST